MGAATLTKPVKHADKPVGKKFKFRLLKGSHREDAEHTYQVQTDPNTKLPICPVFETDVDLNAKFNAPGFPKKFEKLEGEQAPVFINPTLRLPGETLQAWNARQRELQQSIRANFDEQLKELDTLDKDELESFAESEEIVLQPKDTKTAETLRIAIKLALKGS